MSEVLPLFVGGAAAAFDEAPQLTEPFIPGIVTVCQFLRCELLKLSESSVHFLVREHPLRSERHMEGDSMLTECLYDVRKQAGHELD